MVKGIFEISLAIFVTITTSVTVPDENQVKKDATNFHQFRIAVLAEANKLDEGGSKTNAGSSYVATECRKLAQQTSPEYLYGIVDDLIRDTSRTEEPYLIGIMVLDNYPPDQARRVVKQIMSDPKYRKCVDVKNWLWEIDEAEKSRQ